MKYAYVTVLSTNNYYKGVVALFESIKKTNTKINNFVVIVNEDIYDYIINDFISRGYIVKKKKKLQFDFVKNNNYQYWQNTFDKFYVFDLEEYDKIVYLDSDMYIARNIDELFNYPHMSAAIAGKDMVNSWVELGSGMMVIKPKQHTSEKLIETLKNTKFDKDIGDQDVIEAYYDWKNQNLSISENYNLFASFIDYYINNLGYNVNEIGVVHFIGSVKPWMLNKRERQIFLEERKEKNEVYYAQFFNKYIDIIDSIGKKLSIITPFYNTLSYTKKLAEVLDPQLTEEVEWIIIDDGTNEKELDNLKAKVIHLEYNSGNASRPRNIGLEVAKGEYIVFIDSDDLVYDNYVETIINKIDNDKFDYCYFGWENKDLKYEILDEPLEWNHSVWNCVYKREIIGNEQFNVKYNLDEDGDFNNRVRKGKKANIPEILYIYKFLERDDSLSSLYNSGLIKFHRDDS